MVSLAKQHLGGCIVLDPASSKAANNIVGAKHFFIKEDDGLLKQWFGNVFINPPGSPSKWFRKAVSEYKMGNVEEFFFIVYSIDRLPTILKTCSENNIVPTLIIPHKRIQYISSETLSAQTQPLHGSAFIFVSRVKNYIHHDNCSTFNY